MDASQKLKAIRDMTESKGWTHWFLPTVQAELDRIKLELIAHQSEEKTMRLRERHKTLVELLQKPAAAMSILKEKDDQFRRIQP